MRALDSRLFIPARRRSSIRRRVIVPLLLLTSLAARAEEAKPAEKKPSLDDVEYEVLQELLAERLRDDPGRTVVINEFTQAGGDTRSAEHEMPDLETATVKTFIARNREGGQLEAARLRLKNPIHFINGEERDKYWKGDGCEAGWARYREAHPNATGIMGVSRVGINHDRTQALVYLGGQGACLAGGGSLYELEKFKGRWKVVQVVRLWIS